MTNGVKVRPEEYDKLIRALQEAKRLRTPGLILERSKSKGVVVHRRRRITSTEQAVLDSLYALLKRRYPVCLDSAHWVDILKTVMASVPDAPKSKLDGVRMLVWAYERLVKQKKALPEVNGLWRIDPSYVEPAKKVEAPVILGMTEPPFVIPTLRPDSRVKPSFAAKDGKIGKDGKNKRGSGPWMDYYPAIRAEVYDFIIHHLGGRWDKVSGRGRGGTQYPVEDMERLARHLESKLRIPSEMARATTTNKGGHEIKHQIHLALWNLKRKGDLIATDTGVVARTQKAV